MPRVAAFLFASTKRVYGGMEQVRIERQGCRYACADYPAVVPVAARLTSTRRTGAARARPTKTSATTPGCKTSGGSFPARAASTARASLASEIRGGSLGSPQPGCSAGRSRSMATAFKCGTCSGSRTYWTSIRPPSTGSTWPRGGCSTPAAGPAHTVSLLELLDLIDGRLCKGPPVVMADWRPGDQRVFVTDVSKG